MIALITAAAIGLSHSPMLTEPKSSSAVCYATSPWSETCYTIDSPIGDLACTIKCSTGTLVCTDTIGYEVNAPFAPDSDARKLCDANTVRKVREDRNRE